MSCVRQLRSANSRLRLVGTDPQVLLCCHRTMQASLWAATSTADQLTSRLLSSMLPCRPCAMPGGRCTRTTLGTHPTPSCMISVRMSHPHYSWKACWCILVAWQSTFRKQLSCPITILAICRGVLQCRVCCSFWVCRGCDSAVCACADVTLHKDPPARIDYLWSSLEPIQAALAMRDKVKGRYLSDHLAVRATFRCNGSSSGGGTAQASMRCCPCQHACMYRLLAVCRGCMLGGHCMNAPTCRPNLTSWCPPVQPRQSSVQSCCSWEAGQVHVQCVCAGCLGTWSSLGRWQLTPPSSRQPTGFS